MGSCHVPDRRWGTGPKAERAPVGTRSVLDDAAFEKLLAAAESQLKPIILVAYDTGMRLREVLDLRWSQVNLKLGVIELSAEDTKTEEPRTVFLTSRCGKRSRPSRGTSRATGSLPIRRPRRRGK